MNIGSDIRIYGHMDGYLDLEYMMHESVKDNRGMKLHNADLFIWVSAG